ncbi:hypothetical protein, partial [Streptomyces sp. BA2]|uniref:hypothetical protein n=1 Tax=Streptomyces sp. BA2 TaxID=436595 RepID=UPI001F1C65A5
RVEANLSSIKSKGFEIKHCVGSTQVPPSSSAAAGARQQRPFVIHRSSTQRCPAKLSDIRNGNYRTYVTEAVFKKIAEHTKYSSGDDKRLMWEGPYTREVGGETITIYKSSWWSKP